MVGGTYGAMVAPDTQVIGRRVLATIIDVVLLGVVTSLFTAPGALIDGLGDGRGSEALSGVLFSFGGLAALLVTFAYFAIMEGRYGQTLGKMALGIKVVRESDGLAPGTRAAVLRTLMRIVDSIGSYLVAFVVALVSDKNQRLGDMVAKTVVVRA
ncbi:MAG: RDD family protein [Rubrobacter sp.]|nr:RDD family protein [Rubrobacter sp.]MBA3950516.1 RDD family protein [Rubrobacter sp.]